MNVSVNLNLDELLLIDSSLRTLKATIELNWDKMREDEKEDFVTMLDDIDRLLGIIK